MNYTIITRKTKKKNDGRVFVLVIYLGKGKEGNYKINGLHYAQKTKQKRIGKVPSSLLNSLRKTPEVLLTA